VISLALTAGSIFASTSVPESSNPVTDTFCPSRQTKPGMLSASPAGRILPLIEPRSPDVAEATADYVQVREVRAFLDKPVPLSGEKLLRKFVAERDPEREGAVFADLQSVR
jgi:hypothetical protein